MSASIVSSPASRALSAYRLIAVAAFTALMLAPVRVTRSQTARPVFSCPVTQPSHPAFTPTGVTPLPEGQKHNGFYFGTRKLSVLLIQPWFEHETKIPWFSDDVRFPGSVNLKVIGRRLDGVAPPPNFEGPNVARSGSVDFITGAMKFPATGCWEITAEMNGTKLTFVTEVLPGVQR